MRFLDMFGGIGGFRLGLENASKEFECISYIEIDKYAIGVYNYNFKEENETIDARYIKTAKIPEFDLLCAGFPCQSFSSIGKRKGFADPRGTLFFEIMRIVQAKKPSYLLLENVKGLCSHNAGVTLATIFHYLQKVGYDAQWLVIDSRSFGLPQKRERIFILANLRAKSCPKILSIYKSDAPFDHSPLRSFEKEIDKTERNEINIIFKPFSGFFYNESPCLTTKNNIYVINLNRLNSRSLTPLEWERLQGFPDDWTKYAYLDAQTTLLSDTRRYKLLGNSVSIPVIQAIAHLLIAGL